MLEDEDCVVQRVERVAHVSFAEVRQPGPGFEGEPLGPKHLDGGRHLVDKGVAGDGETLHRRVPVAVRLGAELDVGAERQHQRHDQETIRLQRGLPMHTRLCFYYPFQISVTIISSDF